MQGFNALSNWLGSNSEAARPHSDSLVFFIKSSTKDWKENNAHVNKAAFEALVVLCQSCGIPKKSLLAIITPESLDKMSDAKLAESLSTSLLALAETVGPRSVVTLVLKHAGSKPKVLAECTGVIGRIIRDFGVAAIGL